MIESVTEYMIGKTRTEYMIGKTRTEYMIGSVVITTPVHSKLLLSKLFACLESQRSCFNEWHLWINTQDQDTLNYCRYLSSNYHWIREIHREWGMHIGSQRICKFFNYTNDPNTIYIKINDSIVWLEHDFISKLVNFRKKHKDYLLVYPNVVNSGICDYIHSRLGATHHDLQYSSDCLDGKDSIRKHILLNFVQTREQPQWKFSLWILRNHEIISTDCVCWYGDEWVKSVDINVDDWINVYVPTMKSKVNCIYGYALCCNFKFNDKTHDKQILELVTR